MENFGKEPCSSASRTAISKPIESITFDARCENWCVSSLHRKSTIAFRSAGQQRYRSKAKFSRNTVIPVSLASMLTPPKAILNQTAIVSGPSGCLCQCAETGQKSAKHQIIIKAHLNDSTMGVWNLMKIHLCIYTISNYLNNILVRRPAERHLSRVNEKRRRFSEQVLFEFS